MSTTKFINKDGEINSLVLDPSNNTAVVENNNGDILVNYTNGSWAPTNNAPVDILKDSKKGGIFDRAFKSSYDKLSEVDQNKLSIYTSKNNTNNTTVSTIVPSTLKDGLTQKDLDDIRKEEELTEFLVGTGKYKKVKTDGGTVLQVVTNPPWRLRDLNVPIESYPRDPEGFYIGRYPINQKDTNNFDYLKVTCYDYEPGLMQDGGIENIFKIKDMDKRVKTRRGVISLPIQPGISESNGVGWGENELSPIQLAGAQVAGGAIDALTGGGVDVEGFRSAIESNLKVLQGIGDFEEIIKAYFAGQAVGADLIGRATGQAINKNVEVLFNGPQLRTFGYSYRFTPREPREAREIKEIIRFFKKSMAPKRSNSRIFLKSPNVWKLKYTFRNGDSHPFLNNIKICALTGFNVDYTPDGSYSTYDNEGGVGDGSMTSYQVSMSFKELTPIYNDDFWTDDEGQEGTGF
tara:strand:- start:1295 stop:2677 length:1383 start_codon:yes stop_codon:yes gene_type:complete